MTFKPGETYKTRDGREARIYATDGEGGWSIHGATKEKNGWLLRQWMDDGRAIFESSVNDLMPLKRERWVLIAHSQHNGDAAWLFTNRDDAMSHARDNKYFALVRIEYTEGQFDD